MDAEFTVIWTEALERKAYWRRFRDSMGHIEFLASIYLSLLVVFITGFTHYAWTWWTILIGCAAAFLLLVFLYVWIAKILQFRKTLSKFGQFEATYRIADDGLHMRTPQGEVMMPWHKFARLVRHHDLWILGVTRDIEYTLPAEKLTPQVREFIVSKIMEHGGKVRGK